ncbi:hypothetical protein IWQ61_009652 [Dispira simplex]|nr:hypothetical protein IWQ61_009652 [Dispira simplex]
MTEYWPSNRNDNNYFWSHEWNKHGTCVSTLEPRCYGDMYKPRQEIAEYFGQIRNLYNTFDLYEVLRKYNIVPGASYPRINMVNAVYKELGLQPRFYCKRGRLQEVRVWYYVNGLSDYVPAPAFSNHGCPPYITFQEKKQRSRL